MAAFSSAGQVRRRPAPVNTSRRRARSGLCISSEIDICRSSQPAPNIILYARRRKVHPDDANATSPGAKLSPEEPDAGNLHVRVCEGRGWQHPRLLGTIRNITSVWAKEVEAGVE